MQFGYFKKNLKFLFGITWRTQYKYFTFTNGSYTLEFVSKVVKEMIG